MRRAALTPAILASALAFVPSIASAKITPIDITHSAVTCDTVSGVLAIKPSLVTNGGATVMLPSKDIKTKMFRDGSGLDLGHACYT